MTLWRVFIMKVVQFLAAAMLPIAFAAVMVTLVGQKSEVEQMTSSTMNSPGEGTFPSLSGATQWLNSEPLTSSDLRGKVVLINFWTYTCINWLRQFPYVRAWAEKYADQGLVVIGIHTPEFAFEHDFANVRREVTDLGV